MVFTGPTGNIVDFAVAPTQQKEAPYHFSVCKGMIDDLGQPVVSIRKGDGNSAWRNGDIVELKNPDPKSGATFQCLIRIDQKGVVAKGSVAMSKYIRKMLDVKTGSTVELSNYELKRPNPLSRLLGWILSQFVGYSWLYLKVVKGNDADEGFHIVRVSEDRLPLLRVSAGDLVNVFRFGKHVTCRIETIGSTNDYNLEGHKGSLPKDVGDYCVLVCAGERSKLGKDMKPRDIVWVRRSPWYAIQKYLAQIVAAVITAVGLYATINQLGYSTVAISAGAVSFVVLFGLVLDNLKSGT